MPLIWSVLNWEGSDSYTNIWAAQYIFKTASDTLLWWHLTNECIRKATAGGVWRFWLRVYGSWAFSWELLTRKSLLLWTDWTTISTASWHRLVRRIRSTWGCILAVYMNRFAPVGLLDRIQPLNHGGICVNRPLPNTRKSNYRIAARIAQVLS